MGTLLLQSMEIYVSKLQKLFCRRILSVSGDIIYLKVLVLDSTVEMHACPWQHNIKNSGKISYCWKTFGLGHIAKICILIPARAGTYRCLNTPLFTAVPVRACVHQSIRRLDSVRHCLPRHILISNSVDLQSFSCFSPMSYVVLLSMWIRLMQFTSHQHGTSCTGRLQCIKGSLWIKKKEWFAAATW